MQRLAGDVRAAAHAFSRWLVDIGLRSPSAPALKLKPDGITLAASRDAPKGSLLFALPRRATLGFDTAAIESKHAVKNVLDRVPEGLWQLALGMLVLAECRRGSPPSAFKPYLDFLPARISTPLFFPKDVQDALQYAPTQLQLAMRARLLARLSADKEVLSALGLDGSDRATALSDLAWGMSAASSRAFSFRLAGQDGDDPRTARRMLPLVDMMDHSGEPTCAVALSDDLDAVEVRAERDVVEGGELTIKYGDLDNGNFLLDYGFVVDGNPHDSVELRGDLDALSLAADLTGVRVAPGGAEWKRALVGDAGFRIVGRDRGRLDAAARVLLAGEEDARKVEPLDSPAWSLPEGKDTDAGVRKVLASYLGLVLRSFPTTVDEDMALVAAGGLDPQMELAVRFRKGKKGLLVSQIAELGAFGKPRGG
ncbi:hypothetical protein DFJ74DRAFT_702977 [Hyaloraphidium curvatum]|nr:hypothetical protein DFJ74DRAFT_702977 [Hyaloraphidium curvatum]